MEVDDAHRREVPAPHLERALAELAAKQHGVFHMRQIQELGLGARGVQHRAAVARFRRLHRAVYALGPGPVSADGHRLAAVLACGDGAVLSHLSAAEAWGLRRGSREREDVTVADCRVTTVNVHGARRLPAADVTTLRAIPITTVARTLVDLAGVLDADRLARAVHEAEVLRLLDVRAVHHAVARAPGRRGTAKLRALLTDPWTHGPSRTELEQAFRALCRTHRLPRPGANVHVDIGYRLAEVDALFAAERVAVELDSERHHHTRRSFHEDRRRDAAMAALGYVVVRFTWERITQEAEGVADELRRILAARRGPA